MVPLAGLEPALRKETDFESAATTNFTIGAFKSGWFESFYKLQVCCFSFLRNPSFELYRINFCGIEPLRQIGKICFYPKMFAELILQLLVSFIS